MNNLNTYFDYTYYKTKYPDLNRLNKNDAKWHCFGQEFDGDGIKEGRIFCKELELFNKNDYLLKNPTLKNKNTCDIYLHYLNNLKSDKLKPQNKLESLNNSNNDKLNKYFNPDYYKNKYSDLKEINNLDLLNHFIKFGIKEERLFCKELDNFNYDYYKNNYSECEKRTFIEACLYYITIPKEIVTKDTFRILCFKQLEYIREYSIPKIELNLKNEAFLIEFRIMSHIEFLIRNVIIKLPTWSHTIICGNLNYNYLKIICNKISKNIKIIKLNINNCDINKYNNLLLTKEFWENFVGDKLLLYQEDSILFGNNINDLMEYYYIGAPWSGNHNDNSYFVGNGGFSLRTKEKMIEIINKIEVNKLKLNESTKTSITIAKLEKCPEDVYFSKSLIDFNLGLVPDKFSASLFSSEQIFCKNSLGGHNYHLGLENIDVYKYIFYSRVFKCVLFHSCYEYSLGGGEKYLSYLMKYFIDQKYLILFINNTNDIIYNNTLKLYFNNSDCKKIIKLNLTKEIFQYNKLCEYFIYMSNSSYPEYPGVGIKNIYHCQFPFNKINNDKIYINSYDKIIVKSEYTKDNLINYYKNKIEILYPPCIEFENKKEFIKKDNQFVMIGRIFQNDKSANNKYFDIAINVFNNYPKLKLIIIGSVKDLKYYNKLKQLIKNNIEIHVDISDLNKNKILMSSKYYISLTGINDVHNYNYEHFGISYIEALNYNCYPITFNKGYPSLHINKTNYGTKIRNENELNLILLDIIKNNNKYLNKFSDLSKFTYSQYFNNFQNVLN